MVTFLTLEQCRMRRSAKWTEYDSDVLPLPVAEMDVALAPPIAEVLHEAIDRSDTGYAPMDGSHVRAFRSFAQARWGWAPAQEAVVPTSDVGSAVVDVLRYVAGAGAVVVNPPVYPQFHGWPGLAGRRRVAVPLRREDDGESAGFTYRLDLAGLERAFCDGAAAFVLCHPHNPVGRVHTRDELAEVARLAKRYGVLVVSDEVHAPMVFGRSRFVPFLASCPEAAEVGVALHAPSKAWNLAGLKCAFIVAENPRLRERLAPVIGELPWQTGILGALAAEAAYLHGSAWLDELNAALTGHHVLFAAELGDHLPEARLSPAAFGYLAWVDLRALSPSDDPAGVALRLGRVALGVGPEFGEGGEGHVRVNLGTHPEIVRDAVARLATSMRLGRPFGGRMPTWGA